MPIGIFKKALAEVQGRISEIKDAGEFEAAIAACALVGGADNDWDADEVAETIDAIQGHTAFGSFKGQVAQKVAEYEPLATKHGGRRQLLDKCRKAAGGANGASIFFVAVDVAEATGGIEESEAKMLGKVADALGVSGDPDIRELLSDIA
jgi:tellurite resistance protein